MNSLVAHWVQRRSGLKSEGKREKGEKEKVRNGIMVTVWGKEGEREAFVTGLRLDRKRGERGRKKGYAFWQNMKSAGPWKEETSISLSSMIASRHQKKKKEGGESCGGRCQRVQLAVRKGKEHGMVQLIHIPNRVFGEGGKGREEGDFCPPRRLTLERGGRGGKGFKVLGVCAFFKP